MKWLSITIIILQFLSFWLVGPELLGEKGLQKLKSGFIRAINSLPFLLLVALGVLIYEISDAVSESLGFNLLWVSIPVLVIGMLLSKRIANLVDRRVAQPLANNLVHNGRFRITLLKTGILLFILSFIGQLGLEILS